MSLRAIEIDKELRRLSGKVNALFREARKLGLSGFSATNQYPLKLRQGELVEVELRLNFCEHPNWGNGPFDLYCKDCGVTTRENQESKLERREK